MRYEWGGLGVADEPNRRIKFAYHLKDWAYEGGDQSQLKRRGVKVALSEFTLDMEGAIFCPGCYTNLNRVPKDKDHFSNGREAYFAHLSKFSHVECGLRSTKPEGKRYYSYEEAQKAIDDENLVIVNGFVKERPEANVPPGGEYDETPVEDIKGPLADVPISRHSGESFKLPSKITTVRGLCRGFDENLYRYYHLPGNRYAIRLVDLLHDVRRVTGEDDVPKLYFGIIKSSKNAGRTSRNIRMTWLACNPGVKDFCFKVIDADAQEKGIRDDTKDRILIMYGAVIESGIGLAIEKLGWGEYALLPQKYNKLLLGYA